MKESFQKITGQFSALKKQVFQKGSFAQNFTMLFSSNMISQVIGILLLPIISRLYSPELYGVFSVYIAIVTIVGTFSSFRYNAALVLPKEDEEFKALLHLNFVILFVITILTTLVFAIFSSTIFTFLKRPELSVIWYLIPVSILVLGVRLIIGVWNVREKEYRKTSIISVIRNILGRLISIGYAFLFGASFLGLLWGDLLTGVVVVTINYFFIIHPKVKPYLKLSKWAEILAVAKKYKNYPLMIMSAGILEIFSIQLPIYFFAILSSKTFLGLYIFGERLLSLPITIVSNAITPVFLQKIVEIQQTNANKTWEVTRKIIQGVILLGALPLAIVISWGDYIYMVIFGAEWEQAGVITAYLGGFYLLQMVFAIIRAVFNALEKEQYLFWFSMVIFASRALTLSACLSFNILDYDMLFLYSIVNSICFLGGILVVVRVLKGNVLRITLFIVAVILGTAAALLGLRYLIDWLWLN